MTQQEPNLIRVLRGHKQSIIALDMYPSCKYIASAGMDNVIYLWNLTKKTAPHKLIGHKSQIHDLKFSPAGNIIVSASNDESLKFWDIDYELSGKQTTLIKAHNARIRGLSFSCDGLLLASCGDDKLIKVWSTVDRRLQYSLKKHNNWVRHCEFSPTAVNLASCDDKEVYIWDVNTKKQIQSYSQHSGVIHKVKFHSLGNCMATCSHDTKIKLYDLRSQNVVQTYEGHKGPVKSIDFHPHDHYLISSSDDGTTSVWNTKKSQIQYIIETHSNNTRFSRYGDYFITGGSQKIIYIWKTGFYDSLNQKIMGGKIQVSQHPKTYKLSSQKVTKETLIESNVKETLDKNFNTRKNQNEKINSKTRNQKLFTSEKKMLATLEEPQIYYNHQEQFFQIANQPKMLQHSKSMNLVETAKRINTNQSYSEFVLPEKIVSKLSKIKYQLDFITKTTQILEARISNNGDQLKRLLELTRINRQDDISYQ